MPPRFVVQEHHARRLHWDLRLERDGVLASWAVPRGIPRDPARNHLAVRTEDHPIEYLEFEGDIPAGQYGAGTMAIWDRGTYETHKFRADEVMVTFHGERLRGSLRPVPHPRRRLDDPPHGPAGGPGLRAAAGVARADAARAWVRCPPATTAGPSRSSGTACARWRG